MATTLGAGSGCLFSQYAPECKNVYIPEEAATGVCKTDGS
jgi:hypothetical protein